MTAIRGFVLDYTRALLGLHATRLRAARQRGDTGASAMELAIITAIIVGLAIVVLTVVSTVVNNRSTEITSNNGKLP